MTAAAVIAILCGIVAVVLAWREKRRSDAVMRKVWGEDL